MSTEPEPILRMRIQARLDECRADLAQAQQIKATLVAEAAKCDHAIARLGGAINELEKLLADPPPAEPKKGEGECKGLG